MWVWDAKEKAEEERLALEAAQKKQREEELLAFEAAQIKMEKERVVYDKECAEFVTKNLTQGAIQQALIKMALPIAKREWHKCRSHLQKHNRPTTIEEYYSATGKDILARAHLIHLLFGYKGTFNEEQMLRISRVFPLHQQLQRTHRELFQERQSFASNIIPQSLLTTPENKTSFDADEMEFLGLSLIHISEPTRPY